MCLMANKNEWMNGWMDGRTDGSSFQVRQEVKTSSRKNWRVFIAVLEVKLLQNIQSLRNFWLWSCKVACGAFCSMRKKALIMRRMRMLASYADLHHRILSDALSWHLWASKFRIFFQGTLLQARTLSILESVPSEPKPPPTFIKPAAGKHFGKRWNVLSFWKGWNVQFDL